MSAIALLSRWSLLLRSNPRCCANEPRGLRGMSWHEDGGHALIAAAEIGDLKEIEFLVADSQVDIVQWQSCLRRSCPIRACRCCWRALAPCLTAWTGSQRSSYDWPFRDIGLFLLLDPRIENAEDLDWPADCLLAAAERGHEAAVRRLLSDPHVRPDDGSGIKALRVAAQHGRLPVIDVLLADGRIDPSQHVDDHLSPLATACQEGHIAAIERLLADPRVHPSVGPGLERRSALRAAAVAEWPRSAGGSKRAAGEK